MHPTTTRSHPSPRTITVELLAIDLSTCSRCTGSLTNVEQAIAILQDILSNTGTEITFDRILVTSAEQAQQLQFVSSPTIRVNGQDIVLETTESRCGDCSAISGSEGGTACRTWSYQGDSHTEAPVGMIVDAIRRHLDQTAAPIPATAKPVEVPQNLQQFFQDKAKQTAAAPIACCGSPATVINGCGCP